MSRTSEVGQIDGCAETVVHPAEAEHAHTLIPPAPEVSELAETFGLLADPGRLRMLLALRGGELCVCDLAAACGQSESAVSHALRLLRAHRVVAVRRAGRRAYYRLDDDHVTSLLGLALHHLDDAVPDHARTVAAR